MIPHACLDEIIMSQPHDHVSLTVPALTTDPHDYPVRVVVGVTNIGSRTVYPYRLQELRPDGPVTMVTEEDDLVGPRRHRSWPLEYLAVVALGLALQPADLCVELDEPPSGELVGKPPETVAWLAQVRPRLSSVRADLERLRVEPLVSEQVAVAALTILHGLSWDPDRVSSDRALMAQARFALQHLPGGAYRRMEATNK